MKKKIKNYLWQTETDDGCDEKLIIWLKAHENNTGLEATKKRS